MKLKMGQTQQRKSLNNKNNLQASNNLMGADYLAAKSKINNPAAHVDMIIEEYINLKRINQELGRVMTNEIMGKNSRSYASLTEAAIASTKIISNKLTDEVYNY